MPKKARIGWGKPKWRGCCAGRIFFCVCLIAGVSTAPPPTKILFSFFFFWLLIVVKRQCQRPLDHDAPQVFLFFTRRVRVSKDFFFLSPRLHPLPSCAYFSFCLDCARPLAPLVQKILDNYLTNLSDGAICHPSAGFFQRTRQSVAELLFSGPEVNVAGQSLIQKAKRDWTLFFFSSPAGNPIFLLVAPPSGVHKLRCYLLSTLALESSIATAAAAAS